jgi:AraC-like DNA-binding protein
MAFEIIRPAPSLVPFISYYWGVEHINDGNPFTQWVYPQASVQMMFYFGTAMQERTAGGQLLHLPASSLCGISDGYSELTTNRGFAVLGVIFNIPAARQILQIPLSEVRNSSLSLDDWLGLQGRDLTEQMNLANSNRTRVGILESFFIDRLTEPTLDQSRIAAAMRLISRTRGLVSLADLADQACIGERHLQRLFMAYAGTTPKQFCRIIRLNRAISLAKKNPGNSFTRTAIEAGYYDQAHFNKEFREMTGFTPRNFFQR